MRMTRKLILAGGALAALAVPSVASADVSRCQSSATEAATATFTVTQPSGAGGLWTHDFTVTVKPDGTFTGTGVVNGLDYDGPKTFDETVKGTFTDTNNDGTADRVSLESSRDYFYVNSWSLTDAPMD